MVEIDVPVLQDFFDHIIYLEVVKAGLEGASHEEFHREVVYLLFARGMRLMAEFSPSFTEYLHNYRRHCLVDLVIRCSIGVTLNSV